MLRSTVMPRDPFIKLFKSWPCNEFLTVEKLRIKTVVLLSLAAMLRPSDIAPKSYFMQDGERKQNIFSADRVCFQEDGTVKLKLFGIKNDYTRDGFEVVIVPSSDLDVCPVDCLKCYMGRGLILNKDPKRPVFTPLNYPFSALSASSIAGLLSQAISMAGLEGQGYSARLFRPTGASAAVKNDVDPDRVRSIGRWKNQECFEKHYVHVVPEEGTSDAILLS